jgi:uridine kinase
MYDCVEEVSISISFWQKLIFLCFKVRRDMAERGRSIESILNQYEKSVKPSFDDFIAPTKRFADIIIPRGGGNEVATSLLVEHIRSQLEKRFKDFQKSAAVRKRGSVMDFSKAIASILPETPRIRSLMTSIRSDSSTHGQVMRATDTLCKKLISFALGFIPYSYEGGRVSQAMEVCGVSIVRSGEPLANELRLQASEAGDLPLGKLVIQQAAQKLDGPRLFYYKFPKNIKDKFVILTDGVLASANAMTMALRVLLDHECVESNIMVVCLCAAPEGISVVNRLFPKVRIVIASLEEGLDDNMFLIPGVGNFSTRYFSSGRVSLN